jgi:NADPH:quinone reductase-like Zn-dependent oxidoreductase
MRAARIETFGGPEMVHVADVPPPALGPGQVMVDVSGSSINPVDIAVRSGWMAEFVPVMPPLTLGTDIAGIVSDVGEGVADLSPGDMVYGVAGVVMGGSGGFADQAVTSPGLLASVPTGVDMAAAGTLPLAGVSAMEAITERLMVEPGSRVLVHGASGGVGLFAVALAKHLGGHVVATVHRNGSAGMNESGVDDVVNTDTTDLASLPPFDLTLDLVGDDPMLPVNVTKPGGRVVGLRIMADEPSAAEKGVAVTLQATEITTERLNRLRDYVEKGVLVPHMPLTFSLAEVPRAFSVKEKGGVPGKIAINTR